MIPTLLLAGCGQATLEDLVPLQEPLVADAERETAVVERGNLTPVYQQEIALSGYTETAYRVEKDLLDKLENEYEAKVDELLVAVGDHVKAGDLMLSFSSDVLEERRLENEKTLRHATLGIEHYKRLMEIDPVVDYYTYYFDYLT